jgi:DNA repair exonuclease SbcCD nuclease subunit
MNLSNIKRIAVTGDLHCGKHQNSTIWHKITLDWAKWFKEELESKGINTILFLGDLFDVRSEVAVPTLQIAADIFHIWKDFNIVIVIGNHDSALKHSSEINSVAVFSGWQNIKVINNIESLNIGGKKCTFANWGFDLEKLPESQYLFGHFEITTFKMNNYKICDKGVTPDELLKKAPLVFSGHFHHENSRKYGKKSITYVGNPFEMDFGDLGCRKGYYIVDFSTDKFEFFPNNISPIHVKVKSSEFTGKEDIKGKIVKLLIDQKISVDEVDKIVFKISNLQPLQLSIEYTYLDKALITDTADCDLSGIDKKQAIEDFINLLDITDKKQLTELCLEIYNAI